MSIGKYQKNPPEAIAQILSSKEYGPLYQEMVDLQQRVDESEMKDRFHLRRQLDAHIIKLKQYPPLQQLLNLRDGKPLEVAEIESISADHDRAVILVDWFMVPDFLDEGNVLLLTARSSEIPTIDVLPITQWQVVNGLAKYLIPATPDGLMFDILRNYRNSFFNDIYCELVGPIAQRTRKGEMLVSCPTNLLHQLPLHALNVEEDALIHRNPIAYLHSHSLLRTSVYSAQFAAASSRPLNPQFLAGIKADSEEYYAEGRNSIVNLAARFQTIPMIDNSASKLNFIKQAQHSRLLHIHTHCTWDSANPLEHHLHFPRVLDVPNQEHEETNIEERKPDPLSCILAAREGFSLPLQDDTHVNLIACSGGLTDIKPGDEIIGFCSRTPVFWRQFHNLHRLANPR